MKRIKIKIDDLFKVLDYNIPENEDEISFKNNLDIKIKNHNDNFVNINEFVIKKTDSYITLFDNGMFKICSNHHIMKSVNGDMKVQDIYDNGISVIRTLNNITTYHKITSLTLNTKNDKLYDFCLDSPHLWKDVDGFIHHNSLVVYMIARIMHMKNKKFMLIVPNIPLLYQMLADFEEYGWADAKDYIQLIGDKHTLKTFIKPIIITTWQSLYAKRVQFYNSCINDILKNDPKYIKIDEQLKPLQQELKSLLKKHKFATIKKVNKTVFDKDEKKFFIAYEKLDNQLKSIRHRYSIKLVRIKEHLKKYQIDDVLGMFLTDKLLQKSQRYNYIIASIEDFENEITSEFGKINCIAVDECDGSSAESLDHVLTLCDNAKYRIGVSGSMPKKSYSNYYNIIGNFGNFCKYNSYSSLQKDGHMSKFKIFPLMLNYSDKTRIDFYEDTRGDWREELKVLAMNESRNQYLEKMIRKVDGNTLLIFQFKEAEGWIYRDYFRNKFDDRDFYYIDGDVKNRTDLIAEMKASKKQFVCFGSIKTMARGINIPSLKNIFVISSIKKWETLRQIVGRSTRLYEANNNFSRIFDFVDNMVVKYQGKIRINKCVKHYTEERTEFYKSVNLKVNEKDIKLK